MGKEMKFTTDWFTPSLPLMEKAMAALTEKKRFLEIGVFEGRSTVWFLQNQLDADGHITCVDSFNGGQEHAGIKFNEVFERCVSNIELAIRPGQTYELLECDSYLALTLLRARPAIYDFIYVDGSHTAADTLSDAIIAWPMLKHGGVMMFDDYLWDRVAGRLNQPRAGIDAFLDVYGDQLEVIVNGYQLGVKKL